MFRLFFIALAILYSGINLAAAQVLCFKSASIKGKSTRLQLTLPDDGSNLGKVKYENGFGEIEIERVKEIILSEKKVIPAVVSTEFSEIIDGTRVGSYSLITQGATVGELTYKQPRKRKVYKFYDDQDSSISGSCIWSEKKQVH